MAWECPHLSNNICIINGVECRPGRGQCVLKGKFKVTNIDRSKIASRRRANNKKLPKS